MSSRLDTLACRHARNARAYALGTEGRNGFSIRKVVWGRLLATHERRIGEKIMRAIIWIERKGK
jgi:hypothetical protein